MLMGHCLRFSLDWLHSDFSSFELTDCSNCPWTLILGDWMYAQNYAGDVVWVPVVVVSISDP